MVLLGHIASAHGVRGEVVIVSHTADPAAIGDYGPLADGAGGTLELTVQRVTPKGVIARIAGVGDRTAAERLRGTSLHVARERLPEPDAGEYYHADLIGLAVEDVRGHPFGTVVAVQNFGAGDLLEISPAGRRGTILVPFRDAFVPRVDLAAGSLTVSEPERFLP